MKAEPVSSGQPLNLHPLNDCVLVELKQSSDKFSIKEGKYESRTEGILIAWNESNETKLILNRSILGKRVYFDQSNAGDPIKRGGKQYGFIQIKDIRGYEDA